MSSPPRYVHTRLGPSSIGTRSRVSDIALSRGRRVFIGRRQETLGPFRAYHNAPSRSLVSLFPPSTTFQPALWHLPGQRQRTRSFFAKCFREPAGRSTMSPTAKCTCRIEVFLS